jgi:predicted transcriptional regulator
MIAPTPKQAQALALRRAGKKWREIGAELGVTARNAKLYADRAWLKEYRLADAAKEQ